MHMHRKGQDGICVVRATMRNNLFDRPEECICLRQRILCSTYIMSGATVSAASHSVETIRASVSVPYTYSPWPGSPFAWQS